MPKTYKRLHKRRYRKRRQYRKRQMKPTTTVGHLMAGFGDRYFAKITNAAIALQFVGDGTKAYIRNGFNWGDPLNVFGVYKVPAGWTALKQVYDQYLVHGVRLSMNCINMTSTTPVELWVLPMSYDATTAALNAYSSYGDYPYHTRKVIMPQGSGQANVRIKKYYSSKKQLGLKKIESQGSNLYIGFTGGGTSAYTPSSIAQTVVTLINPNNTSFANLTNYCTIEWEVEYYIEFFDRLSYY